MLKESEQPDEVGLLPRVLAGTVGVFCRHPWLVLLFTLVSCAVCGIYTWSNLTYLTHRNDLISKHKDYLKRWHQYVAEFGDDDDMVVVVQGDERETMEQALDELAARDREAARAVRPPVLQGGPALPARPRLAVLAAPSRSARSRTTCRA